MPLVFHKKVQLQSDVAVWKITETEEELLQMVSLTAAEFLKFTSYKSDHRRKQWLSYRALLWQFMQEDNRITYNQVGKPFLHHSHKHHHLSITHSGDFSAVIINPTQLVGIDIERPSQRILNVAEKFLSAAELAFIDDKNPLNHLTICWAVKEAIFKIHGDLLFDFKTQICIDPFNYSTTGTLTATIFDERHQPQIHVSFDQIQDYFLAYLVL